MNEPVKNIALFGAGEKLLVGAAILNAHFSGLSLDAVETKKSH